MCMPAILKWPHPYNFDLNAVVKILGIEDDIDKYSADYCRYGVPDGGKLIQVNNSDILKWHLKRLILSWYPDLHIHFPGLRAGIK